jgi:hypothetical protein
MSRFLWALSTQVEGRHPESLEGETLFLTLFEYLDWRRPIEFDDVFIVKKTVKFNYIIYFDIFNI